MSPIDSNCMATPACVVHPVVNVKDEVEVFGGLGQKEALHAVLYSMVIDVLHLMKKIYHMVRGIVHLLEERIQVQW